MPWQWTSNSQQGGWGNGAWSNGDRGKGKGKGKGSEEPSGRKWPCPSEKCKAHHKGTSILMLPHLKCCRICSTPKAAAPAIEQAALLKLREEAKQEMEAKAEAPVSKRQQKLARNAETKRLAKEKEEKEKKEAAKAPAKPAASPKAPAPPPTPTPTPPTPPNDAEAKDEWAAKELPTAVTDAVDKVAPSIEAILESVALDKFPTPKTVGELETEILAMLAPLQPALASKEPSELEKKVADLQSLLVLGSDRMPKDIHDDLKARLVEAENQQSKAAKKSPTPALVHANLVQARAAASTACTQRSERAKVGADKAGTRSSERLQLVDAGISALNCLRAALRKHDEEFSQCHAARALVVNSSEKALLERYDTKIAAAAAAPDAPSLAATEAEFAAAAAEEAAAEELATWKARFTSLQKRQAEEATSMQEQIEGLQASQRLALAQKTADEAAAVVAAAAAAETAATDKKAWEDARTAELIAEGAAKSAWAVTTAQFEVTTACDSGQLPDLLPDESTLEHCSNLFYLLQHWSLAGGSVPFCLGDLSKEATAKEGTELLVKDLLGPLWEALFPSGTTEKTIFPRQAVLIILHSLERLKARFESVEETRKAAGASYAVISEISKKRRTTGQ